MWLQDRISPDRGRILHAMREAPGRGGPGAEPGREPRGTSRRCAGDLAPAQGLGVACAISLVLWTAAFVLARYAV